MAKISLIGAGSVVFARRLLQDIVCVPELSDSTVSLMDIDPERLALMSKFAKKLSRDTGTNIKVETTLDRREALDGSDYVLTTIRVGDSYERDIAIPLKYGVDQSVTRSDQAAFSKRCVRLLFSWISAKISKMLLRTLYC